MKTQERVEELLNWAKIELNALNKNSEYCEECLGTENFKKEKIRLEAKIEILEYILNDLLP